MQQGRDSRKNKKEASSQEDWRTFHTKTASEGQSILENRPESTNRNEVGTM